MVSINAWISRSDIGASAEASRVPQAVGGPEKKGVITVFAHPGTHFYYQPLSYPAGGATSTPRSPAPGAWLDRQWFPDYVGAFNGPVQGAGFRW